MKIQYMDVLKMQTAIKLTATSLFGLSLSVVLKYCGS